MDLKMSFIKMILSLLVLLSFPAQGNRILKIKKHKALVEFKNTKAQQGEHFEVLDLYGHLQGILRITRTHKKKAIGILISGDMKAKWNLEPISNKQVLKLEALLKKKKIPVRSIASQKREVRKKMKRKLKKELKKLKKKRSVIRNRISKIEKKLNKRKIAQEEEKVYVVENDPFFNSSQNTPDTNPVAEQEAEEYESQFSSVTVGMLYKPQFKMKKITSLNTRLTGISYIEPRLFAEGIYKSKVSIQANLGYSEFELIGENKACGDSKNCYLRLLYALAGLELKIKMWENEFMQFKAGIQGNLMYPINDFVSESNIGLTKNSSGIHGELGLIAGTDFKLGSFIIPIYANANLHIPPTQNIQFWSFGLTTGLGWKF